MGEQMILNDRINLARVGEYPCVDCPDVNVDGGRCINDDICVAWEYFLSGNLDETITDIPGGGMEESPHAR